MTNSYNETSGASSYTPSLKKLELQNTHEQIQLKEQHEHEARMAELKYSQENTLKDKDCAHEQALKISNLHMRNQWRIRLWDGLVNISVQKSTLREILQL